MSFFKIERFIDSEITEEVITAAAKFFSANYGIWGPLAAEKIGPFAKPGARIKLSPSKLREKILPPTDSLDTPSTHIYIRLTDSSSSSIIGNLFATLYTYKPGHQSQILWITQLCVHSNFRNQGIAKRMLESLKDIHDVKGVGILSSHPFAILAILGVFGGVSERGNGSGTLDVEWMSENAREIMGSCPVRYVREAMLKGRLFEEGRGEEQGVISCADTGFWVDHREPVDALNTLGDTGRKWALGHLPKGHEFLVIVRRISSDRNT